MKRKKLSRRARIFSRVPHVFSHPLGGIPSDVQGSYTGVPADGEQPVQDADDL